MLVALFRQGLLAQADESPERIETLPAANFLLNMNFTKAQITAAMHRAEKRIAYFNAKFSYDIANAPAKAAQEWRSALARWDVMKVARDQAV